MSWKYTLIVKVEENGCQKNELDSDNDSFTLQNDICSEEEILIDEDEVKCFHCNVGFKSKVLLKKHISQTHVTRKRMLRKKNCLCEFCMKTYANQNALKRHLRICKRNSEVTQAGKAQNTKMELSKRTNFINDNVSELDLKVPPTCSLCGTTFCNKYLLKRHLQNVHATEKKFKCDMCDRTFASSVYLNAHKRYHAGDRSHICSFCGKGFITASDLYHHEKIHANKRAYRCEICPKAFNTSSDLHKHKICVHLDRSEWKYVCSYCQRRFPLKTNLDTHVKTHTGEKNYACHLCDRRCINKSVLTRHIETHSNVISFKCNLCMQGYKYRKSLDVHMTKVHGIGNVKVPERIKKFFCHLCPKSYFANNKLQKHIRSHNGERPFRCPHCEKSFVDKSYIKQHLKTAHDICKLEDL
ncbi:zinc finger protein 585B-like [Anoplophora glabripennis]|uniref:zinc finger protein 585B-like n=1 Tax=Anoplophora glabripennis TaxID=217634 RepID=UPI00087448C5|nr:zinc finger protein 585B-like [Anoplophora glabripennis]